MKAKCLILILALLFTFKVKGQESNLPSFPEPLTLLDQDGFYKLMGAAVLSFAISELVMNERDINYYQLRGSFYAGENYNVYNQQVGIEKKLSHWFTTGLELNIQEWSGASSGAGVGLNTIYRWYAFGKKRLSPFLEYGAGVYYGFSAFPADGTNFTFHLTSNIGLEYELKNKNKVRLTYGHLHQSNNELLEPNPGFDATGFTLTYLFNWHKTKSGKRSVNPKPEAAKYR